MKALRVVVVSMVSMVSFVYGARPHQRASNQLSLAALQGLFNSNSIEEVEGKRKSFLSLTNEIKERGYPKIDHAENIFDFVDSAGIQTQHENNFFKFGFFEVHSQMAGGEAIIEYQVAIKSKLSLERSRCLPDRDCYSCVDDASSSQQDFMPPDFVNLKTLMHLCHFEYTMNAYRQWRVLRLISQSYKDE